MICVKCRSDKLSETKKRLEETVGRLKFVGFVPAQKCRRCGETYFRAVDGARFQTAVAQRLANMGAVEPAAFRFMRRAIALQSAELAQLLGVTRETISRWETGKRDVDRTAALALGDLVLDHIAGQETTRRRLQAVSPRNAAAAIRVEIDAA